MKITQETAQEKLDLQVPIPISTHLIYRDLMNLDTWFDTSQSIKLTNFKI